MGRAAVNVACALLAVLWAAPAVASVTVEEEETVFRIPASGAERVYLVGDFNGWNPTIDLLVPAGDVQEIRLYLLPGTYRYRFIADGVSLADPDNPCRDEEGNSCFALADVAGRLEIRYTDRPIRERTAGSQRLRFSTSISLAADRDGGALDGEGRIAGTVDERAGIDCAIGLSGAADEAEILRGDAFLLRGAAEYDFDGRTVRVFTRFAEALNAEKEPLPLFGSVGPYRYPVGLMSRGVGFEGALPLDIDARIVYASRIAGYRSGLEETAAAADTSSRRDLLDADALAVRIGAKLGRSTLQALYRLDSRPRIGTWRLPGSSAAFGGYERVRMWGLRFAASGEAGCGIDGAFLLGRSDRVATERRFPDGEIFEPSSVESEWERGYRFVIVVSRDGERADARFACGRTTIDPLALGEPERTWDAISGELSYERGPFAAAVEGSLDLFGSSGAGNLFRVAGTNFWLDGDDVAFDLLPFLSSRETYASRIALSWNREPFEGLPWGTGLALRLLERRGNGAGAPRLTEARFESGTLVHRRVAFLLDLRGVSYRYAGERREFVDAFLGLHGAIAESFWCLVGCGVNPYVFDRWLFSHAGHGRERYLEERGVLDVLARRGEHAAVGRLLDAEESLADDWQLLLQAGFTF